VLEWVESASAGQGSLGLGLGYWEVSSLTGHKVHTLAQQLANAAVNGTNIGVVRSCAQSQESHGIHRAHAGVG
jgi:hypothetical protein